MYSIPLRSPKLTVRARNGYVRRVGDFRGMSKAEAPATLESL